MNDRAAAEVPTALKDSPAARADAASRPQSRDVRATGKGIAQARTAETTRSRAITSSAHGRVAVKRPDSAAYSIATTTKPSRTFVERSRTGLPGSFIAPA